MTADSGALKEILASGDAVAVAVYHDDPAREALVELCELLAERPCARTSDVEAAFGAEQRDRVLLLTPADEVAAVQVLEGRREALREREAVEHARAAPVAAPGGCARLAPRDGGPEARAAGEPVARGAHRGPATRSGGPGLLAPRANTVSPS